MPRSRSRSRSGSRSSRSRSSRPDKRGGSYSPAARARDPRDQENPRRIWVGGLSDRIVDEDLKETFEKFGKVVEVKIRSTTRDTFAFVEFDDHQAAKDAIEKVDQARVRGNRVKCNWASFKGNERSDKSSGGRHQIWVGRLNDQTTERTIRKHFDKYGDILSLQLRSTSKDVFCFIEYTDRRACEEAIEDMHERNFDGARIVVDYSKRGNNSGRRNQRRRSYSPRRRSYSPRRRSRSRERRRRNPPPEGKYKVEIENLPSEMTWMDLKNLTRKMNGGECITFARTYSASDGTPCGLLEFETKRSMEKLIKELDGKRINSHKVKMRVLNDDGRR